ncbi:MAG: hypothetical protein J6T74_00550 [Clostridia bacterium]|nr:hypothetical protein [Clostridia bacterium]
MKYKIIKRKVYKKLIYDKLLWTTNIMDNEYLGLILGYFMGYVCFFTCFIPASIISLYQLKKYIKKIQYDIDVRPEYIKNWKHLGLVEIEQAKESMK